MNVQPHRSLLRQHVDGQHVEHHFDIAHRVDVAVEVDVAVNHAVFGRRGRAYRTDLARLVRRGLGIDDGVGMRIAHPREVDRRTALQVDHRPLRHGAAEFAACGIGQREVSRREHPAVIADPRSHGVVGVLRGLAVEFDGHARKHPWLSAFSASTPNPLPWASMPAVLSIEPPSEGIVARSVKSTSCGSTR